MLFGFFCSLAVLLLVPGVVLANPAHAEYLSSDPAANAMLTKAPTMITVHFSEALNPSGSDITVSDVDGKLVSTSAAQIDRSDLKTMTVTMQGDQSEVYVVNWHTVSAMEGHRDASSFRFFVNISPMLKGMVGSPSMSGSSPSSASGMSSGSASSSSLSETPIWITVLVGVLGLFLGSAAVFALTRRPKPSSHA
jgi:methionine-rich copper-binding protein CopC